jgi:hypothetical protein
MRCSPVACRTGDNLLEEPHEMFIGLAGSQVIACSQLDRAAM